MKIKVNLLDYQRQIIEEQEKNWLNALPREIKRHKKEMADIRKRLAEYRKFWRENTRPVFDWKKDNNRRDEVDISQLYETERVWSKNRGAINISTLKAESGWVCKYCRKEAVGKYVGCADSRYDETFYTCDCKGARKNGKPWVDLGED